MIVHARRASAVLFNLLYHRVDPRPFLLPANICPIVPLTFRKAGQTYRFLDIEERGLGLDRKACRQLLEEDAAGFAGLVYVRPYGTIEDVSAFFRSARSRGRDFLVIDDRCLCSPDPDAVDVSSEADVTLFSTGRAKPVDLGGGGFAHLRPGLDYTEARLEFDAAAVDKIEHEYKTVVRERRPFRGSGGAWLDLGTPDTGWDAYREHILMERGSVAVHRRALNQIYSESLPRSIQLPSRFHGWRFQIRVPDAPGLLDRLSATGLFASRHYASLGHGIFGAGEYPVAEALAKSIVNLFNDLYYDRERAKRTVEVVRDHLRHQAARGRLR